MNNGRLAFFNLVKKMRAAQKEYFRTRTHSALVKSKDLERRFECDALRRARRHLHIASSDYFYGYDTTNRWAQYATMPVDKPAERNIEYWK